MATRNQKALLIGAVAFGAIGIFLLSRRKQKAVSSKNYIIGDSYGRLLETNSKKASRPSGGGGAQPLWAENANVASLKSAVDSYPVSNDINTIIISIGTNGAFNPQDDIEGLAKSVKAKFPNAKLFAIQGAWGWGDKKNITNSDITKYYDRFLKSGIDIIMPSIGQYDAAPTTNSPTFERLGGQIDKVIV